MPETRPIVTIDVVLMSVRDGRLVVALQKRPRPPFAGELALVGGYIHTDEDADTDAAAARILADKTGLRDVFIEQLVTVSGPDRDPRGWSLSVAYFALVREELLEDAVADDTLVLVDVETAVANVAAFDHRQIIETALRRVRGKGAYSVLPARLLPQTFTMGELQAAYEAVLGTSVDQSSFRRKIMQLGIVEETSEISVTSRRPAALYRLVRSADTFDRLVSPQRTMR